MPDELPDCPHCDTPSATFEVWGSSMGPGYLSQGFGCPCGAYFQYTQQSGGNLLVAFGKDQLVPLGESGESEGFPSVYTDWMDDVVLPTWRYRARHPSDAQSVPCPPKVPAELEVFVRIKDVDGGMTWVHIDEEMRQISMSLEVPEDPVLTDSKIFFETVFGRVCEQVEGAQIQPTPIANRYYPEGTKGVPPWMAFEIGASTFRVGWRKRVVAIQVTTPTGLPTKAIEPIAVADRVTFTVLGEPLHIETREDYQVYLDRVLQVDIDKGKLGAEEIEPLRRVLVSSFPEEGGKDVTELPEPGLAHFLEIHAWNNDKAIEYLTVLCREALGLSDEEEA